jgi:ribulose 1,5-bisphosphate synthetase/thiazole synthase
MDEYCGHDVIVINGGSEGLGAYLGMAGRRVLVIDARDEGGGQGFGSHMLATSSTLVCAMGLSRRLSG